MPKAVDGYMDLSSWDFKTNGVADLHGQWEFYWHHLHTPEAFQNTLEPGEDIRIVMPSLWRHYRINGEKLSPDGYATYRLHLRLPQDTPSLALSVRGIAMAHRLFINGKLAIADGQVAISADQERRGDGNNPFIPVPLAASQSGALELVLQVSNHSYWSGGAYAPFIQLGTTYQIQGRRDLRQWFQVSAITVLLSISVYHMLLFFFRRKNKSTLFFSVFCLLWVIQSISSTDFSWMLSFLFPDHRPIVISHIELAAYFFTFPMLLLFLNSLFPQDAIKAVPKVYLASASLLSILQLFSAETYFISAITGHIPSVFCMFFFLTIALRALRRKRASSTFIFTGGILLSICGVNDILFYLHVIDTGYITPVGLIVFIFFQTCALANHSSKSFSETETLAAKLRTSNRSLQRMDKLKDDFLSHTSHELRTPLNGIIGMTEALLGGATDAFSRQTVRDLSLIVDSGRRLTGLINDILDYSRLKHKDIVLSRNPTNLNAVSGMVLGVCKKLANEKGIEIENRIPLDLPLVDADDDRLQQILFNLVGNAIKFTDKGNVILSAKRRGEMIEISVTDTGYGIPQEDLHRVFAPFEQAVSDRAPDRPGTGIGLTVTQKLVELHGGKIWVASRMGTGSVFTFTLPASSEKDVFVRAPAIDLPSPPPGPENDLTETSSSGPQVSHAAFILVVDDEPLNCQVVSAHLSRENILSRTASNGQRALEIVGKGPLPDLILLDVLMPGMNGYDVCRKLRETYSASELPIIMLTALDRMTDLATGFDAGANDYLTKPFSRQELLVRINAQIELKKAYETLRENMMLKQELTLRKRTELHLKMMQRKLSAMLHKLDDAMLAVNTSGEISFCNRAFEALTGFDADNLIGTPFTELFSFPENMSLLAIVSGAPGRFDAGKKEHPFKKVAVKRSNAPPLHIDLLLMPLTLYETSFHMITIKKSVRDGDDVTMASPEAIMRINRNASRIQAVRNLLEQLETAGEMGGDGGNGKAFDAIDMLLDQQKKNNIGGDNTPSIKREMAVQIMNLSTDYWHASTKTTKTELADRSGLWHIYIERDGYARTQTLDKYFSLRTLPANPRWKKILNTADFVLATCSLISPLRIKLEERLSQFREIF